MVMKSDGLVVVLHMGVGLLRFGMSPDDVHRFYGEPDWRRPPDPIFGSSRERYLAHRFFVDFSRDGRCCSVEMYPDARALLDGIDLMAMTYHELVRYLRGRGASVLEEGDGFRCDDLGLAGYAPDIADPELSEVRLQGLLVYPHGYYDELDAHLAKSAK